MNITTSHGLCPEFPDYGYEPYPPEFPVAVSIADDHLSTKKAVIKECEWRGVYERTVTITTPEFTLQHPSSSHSECELLRELNAERLSGPIKWTVIEIDPEESDAVITAQVKAFLLSGDFFTRVWFLRKPDDGVPVGILQTTCLDSEGMTEITRHIKRSDCRKGFGTGALKAIINYYQTFHGCCFEIPATDTTGMLLKTELKTLLKSSRSIHPVPLTEPLVHFLKQIYAFDSPPQTVPSQTVFNAVHQVEGCYNRARLRNGKIRGITSVPISLAASYSLKKAGFTSAEKGSFAYMFALNKEQGGSP